MTFLFPTDLEDPPQSGPTFLYGDDIFSGCALRVQVGSGWAVGTDPVHLADPRQVPGAEEAEEPVAGCICLPKQVVLGRCFPLNTPYSQFTPRSWPQQLEYSCQDVTVEKEVSPRHAETRCLSHNCRKSLEVVSIEEDITSLCLILDQAACPWEVGWANCTEKTA